MGKSLVIKGADFSKNGFTYGYETLDVNTLYYKGTGQATLIQNVNEWPVAEADGKVWYNATHDNTYTLLGSCENSCVFKRYPVGDYTKVKVRTVCANRGDYVILGCVDANDKLLGGFVTTLPEGYKGVILTPVGFADGYREFEMNIPEGTAYIIATFNDTATGNYSPFGENGFKVTLSKVAE